MVTVAAVNPLPEFGGNKTTIGSTNNKPTKTTSTSFENKLGKDGLLELLGRARTLITDGKAQGEIVVKYGPEDVSVSTQHTVDTPAFFQFLQSEATHSAKKREEFFKSLEKPAIEIGDNENSVSGSEQTSSENSANGNGQISSEKPNGDIIASDAGADKKEKPDDDPLKGFKEALFGKEFSEVLKPKEEDIKKAVEAGELVPEPSTGETFFREVHNFIKDTNATGKVEIEYSPDKVTFKTSHKLGTPKLLEALDLVLKDGKEVKVLDREAGRKLVQIMAKYGRQYMQQQGIPITEAGFKKIVKEAAKSGENGGIIFKGGKPEEVQKDMREWSSSLTPVDKLFFGKIFSGGICQRKAVFEEIARAVASENT